jgi:hypothetical protein
MAQVAHSGGIFPVMNLAVGNSAVPIWDALLTSNVLVSTGDVVYATAGYVTSAETTDKYPVGVTATRQAASTTTFVSVGLYPAADWVVFKAQYGGTATQASIWTAHSFAGTRGKHEVSDGAGGKCTWIIAKESTSSFGAYTDVYFLFLKSKFTGKTFDSAGPAV